MPASRAAAILLDRFDRPDAAAAQVLAARDRAEFRAEPFRAEPIGDVRSAGRDSGG
jgi:hypothetical protein